MGRQDIALVTREGQLKGMRYQATTNFKKPLASVKRIIEEGHAVVFAPLEYGGSFILNMSTVDETHLREDARNAVFDAWVPPPSAVGFPRHSNGLRRHLG